MPGPIRGVQLYGFSVHCGPLVVRFDKASMDSVQTRQHRRQQLMPASPPALEPRTSRGHHLGSDGAAMIWIEPYGGGRMRTAVKFVLVAAVAVVAACSGPALPSSQAIAGPVAEPDLINTPNTHWINRDQQCTTSDTPGATHGQVFQPSETAPPDPAKCPSPEPVPGAAAIALGKPLSVSKIAVPITGLGTVRVPVGQVTLPNGYYTSKIGIDQDLEYIGNTYVESFPGWPPLV